MKGQVVFCMPTGCVLYSRFERGGTERVIDSDAGWLFAFASCTRMCVRYAAVRVGCGYLNPVCHALAFRIRSRVDLLNLVEAVFVIRAIRIPYATLLHFAFEFRVICTPDGHPRRTQQLASCVPRPCIPHSNFAINLGEARRLHDAIVARRILHDPIARLAGEHVAIV